MSTATAPAAIAHAAVGRIEKNRCRRTVVSLTTKDVHDASPIDRVAFSCSSELIVHSVAILDDGRAQEVEFSRGTVPDLATHGSLRRDPNEFYKSVCTSRCEPSLQVRLQDNDNNKREDVRLEITYTVPVGTASRVSGYACSWNTAGWTPCVDPPDGLIE